MRGQEEQEESIIEVGVSDLRKLIMYLELTRRNYISLFKQLIMNNAELLGKINIKMLKIIMAKELKIEEQLKAFDIELGPDSIEEYFLDGFCFEKKSRCYFPFICNYLSSI